MNVTGKNITYPSMETKMCLCVLCVFIFSVVLAAVSLNWLNNSSSSWWESNSSTTFRSSLSRMFPVHAFSIHTSMTFLRGQPDLLFYLIMSSVSSVSRFPCFYLTASVDIINHCKKRPLQTDWSTIFQVKMITFKKLNCALL